MPIVVNTNGKYKSYPIASGVGIHPATPRVNISAFVITGKDVNVSVPCVIRKSDIATFQPLLGPLIVSPT